MSHISRELARVFEKAGRIYFEDKSEDINCLNLLISAALSPYSYGGEVLSRLGINERVAKSFILSSDSNNKRNITFDAENAINKSRKIAFDYDYEITCSHHLLLAIMEQKSKEIAQILKDFDITYYKVTEIVESMCYNGIGKETKEEDKTKNFKVNKEIKNKEFEKEIMKTIRKKI